MYIRKTSRKNKDGSKVTYVQLAHNVWDSEKGYSRPEIIHNFGRLDQLDLDSLERLARSICRLLDPAAVLRVEAMLEGNGDIRIENRRAMGGAWLLDQLWQQLGMKEVLLELIEEREFRTPVERLVFAMVANRALAPMSKLAIEEWVAEDVRIEELEGISSQQLYRAMDFLLGCSDDIQKEIYDSVANILTLEVDLLYFDTTSTYFAIEGDDEDSFRKQGFSKDKRPDLPQVVIGLAVTRDGIPVRHWVWPGNTADVSVIDEVKGDLMGWKLGRVISVLDRGFVSEDNLRTLQKAGGHYIIGEKLRSGKPEVEQALSRKGRYRKVQENLETKEIVVGTGEARHRYVLVRNPKQAERDRARREKILKKIEEELRSLRYLPDGQHTKAVCELRSHKTYGSYLRLQKNGRLKIDRSKVKDEERLDGKYLLRTSDDTLDPEDVALGYKQLVDIEEAFRTLKQTLELRPVYHRLEDRIRSHVMLCWLALLLIRVAENKADRTWAQMRRILDRMVVADLTSTHGIWTQRTETTKDQESIFKALDIPEPPRVISVQSTTH
jgi:transposase